MVRIVNALSVHPNKTTES